MSAVAMKHVWEHSEAKGIPRLVHLCLASYVAYEKWERGEGAIAYPSQGTLARRCNCTRQAVNRALRELQDLAEIKDTGERWLRGAIIWDLVLVDRVHSGDLGVTGFDTSEGEDEFPWPAPVKSADTHLSTKVTGTCQNGGQVPVKSADTKRGVKREVKKEDKKGSSADAPDFSQGKGNSQNSNNNQMHGADEIELTGTGNSDAELDEINYLLKGPLGPGKREELEERRTELQERNIGVEPFNSGVVPW